MEDLLTGGQGDGVSVRDQSAPSSESAGAQKKEGQPQKETREQGGGGGEGRKKNVNQKTEGEEGVSSRSHCHYISGRAEEEGEQQGGGCGPLLLDLSEKGDSTHTPVAPSLLGLNRSSPSSSSSSRGDDAAPPRVIISSASPPPPLHRMDKEGERRIRVGETPERKEEKKSLSPSEDPDRGTSTASSRSDKTPASRSLDATPGTSQPPLLRVSATAPPPTTTTTASGASSSSSSSSSLTSAVPTVAAGSEDDETLKELQSWIGGGSPSKGDAEEDENFFLLPPSMPADKRRGKGDGAGGVSGSEGEAFSPISSLGGSERRSGASSEDDDLAGLCPRSIRLLGEAEEQGRKTLEEEGQELMEMKSRDRRAKEREREEESEEADTVRENGSSSKEKKGKDGPTAPTLDPRAGEETGPSKDTRERMSTSSPSLLGFNSVSDSSSSSPESTSLYPCPSLSSSPPRHPPPVFLFLWCQQGFFFFLCYYYYFLFVSC